MRTKTMLLVAALSAAGIASSMAQVYSVNIVGYANVPLKGNAALTLIANPLDDGAGNKLTNILKSVVNVGSAVQTWNGSSFNSVTRGKVAWPPGALADSLPLPPGVGFFLKNGNAGAVDVTNTFVGTVIPNPGASVTNTVLTGLGAGYPNGNLFGSIAPFTGDLATGLASGGDTNLNLGATLGRSSSILTWKNNGPTYSSTTKGNKNGLWGATANIGVGEGFFVNSGTNAVKNWIQTLP